MELETQIKTGIKVRYQLQPLSKEGVQTHHQFWTQAFQPSFWSPLCRDAFPLGAQLSFYFLPCGSSGCMTADHRVTGSQRKCHHWATSMSVGRASASSPHCGKAYDHKPRARGESKLLPSRTEFLTLASSQRSPPEGEIWAVDIPCERSRKEKGNMPSTARPGSTRHQQTLTGCTAEIHMP